MRSMTSLGKVAAAATFSATLAVLAPTTTAHAEVSPDQFLSALDTAGVSYGDPGTAVDMAKSVCPLLKEPGANLAGVASEMGMTGGVPPGMASLFTSIAISMYCPNMMAQVVNGDWLGTMTQLQQIPGLQFGR